MNAPFNSGRATARAPFMAFVCDDDTAATIGPVVAELGWPEDKVSRGGMRNAIQTLAVSASPNILMVDLSESGDPLNDINALAEVCEPGTVVIATGQINDVRLYRDLLSSGLQDYLLKPFSPDALRDTLAHAQAIFSAPKATEASTERQHVSCAVIGARGGVGASTVALSLAWLFGKSFNRSTALLDLDVHFGTGALGLDLEPGRGLTDAIENPGRIDGLFIERAMVKANERLSVLSAEAPLNQSMVSDGGAYHQLQEEMRAAFDATVIDMPRSFMVHHPELLGDVNSIVLVTELTLAAARDVIRIQSWLKTNAPGARLLVVANKSGAGSEIGTKDFESSIERKIDLTIPLDDKVAAQAAKLGQPIAEAAKGAKITLALTTLARRVADEGAPDEGEEASSASTSLLGKLTSLSLPKPKGKAKVAEEAAAA